MRRTAPSGAVRASFQAIDRERTFPTNNEQRLLPHHPHYQVAHHRAVQPAAPPHAGDRAAVAAAEEVPIAHTEHATDGHGADRDPDVPHGAKVGGPAHRPR